MSKLFKYSLLLLISIALLAGAFYSFKKLNINPTYKTGQKIDSLHGVYVYYNGGVSHIEGRNITTDGYNLGLKYQCVEFVKRYYYEALHHKMPDSYGNAKDFFNTVLKDGQPNAQRNLIQYTNPSSAKPQIDDLVIYSSTTLNPYGHVAIISAVSEIEIEIIQQNPGPFASSRVSIPLKKKNNKWEVEEYRVLGWLRKK